MKTDQEVEQEIQQAEDYENNPKNELHWIDWLLVLCVPIAIWVGIEIYMRLKQ
jgi:hypothetical protein